MEVLVSLRGLERLDKDDFADEEKEEAEEIFKARLEERLEQDQVRSTIKVWVMVRLLKEFWSSHAKVI